MSGITVYNPMSPCNYAILLLCAVINFLQVLVMKRFILVVKFIIGGSQVLLCNLSYCSEANIFT